MKTSKKLMPLLLLQFCIFFSYAQTKITTKDFEVSTDVVKIEEVRFKENNKSNYSKGEISVLINYLFNDGLLISKETTTYNSSNEPITYASSYEHTITNKEYKEENYIISRDDKKSNITISSDTLHKIEFANLSFFVPKSGNKITKNVANSILNYEFLALIGVQNGFLKVTDTKNISHTKQDFLSSTVQEYNSKGNMVKLKSGSTQLTYNYSKDGLVLQSNDKESGMAPDDFDTYFYKKDDKDNWIKKVQTHKQEGIIYATRKITYKNGKTSGSATYDYNYLKKLIADIDAGKYKNYIEKNIEK